MQIQTFCGVKEIHYITLLKLSIYFCIAYFNLSCELNWHCWSFFLRISNTWAELQYPVNRVVPVQQMDSDGLSFSDLSVDVNSYRHWSAILRSLVTEHIGRIFQCSTLETRSWSNTLCVCRPTVLCSLIFLHLKKWKRASLLICFHQPFKVCNIQRDRFF